MTPRALILSLALLLAAPAVAQTPTTAAAPAAPTAKASPSKADRVAKSKECSAEADKQGLHGKARKKFRNACRRG